LEESLSGEFKKIQKNNWQGKLPTVSSYGH